METKNNYLEVSAISYPPKLKLYRGILMLTLEDKNKLVGDTNDSALRLYEYYIGKQKWKHFNPTSYCEIGKALNWSASKTESVKNKLVKAGYVLIKKDTLKDGTKIYRVLLGKEMVHLYNTTKEFPSREETVTLDGKGMYDDE